MLFKNKRKYLFFKASVVRLFQVLPVVSSLFLIFTAV